MADISAEDERGEDGERTEETAAQAAQYEALTFDGNQAAAERCAALFAVQDSGAPAPANTSKAALTVNRTARTVWRAVLGHDLQRLRRVVVGPK